MRGGKRTLSLGVLAINLPPNLEALGKLNSPSACQHGLCAILHMQFRDQFLIQDSVDLRKLC
jgi:hypothetical protein